ncbi:MAG TPA: response regulator [Lacunisphaera sp.]|jgi:DNA-binding NtrC family response regulator|nr:response regulator [Lacunisphaera sp.]
MNHLNQVLVVEDNLQDYVLVTQALKEAGYRFGARCIDRPEELEEELLCLCPDLVLCDHGSAKWDSLQILGQVREFEPSLPFIVVSGGLDEFTEASLLARGADACVSKQRLDALPDAVRRTLELHRQRQRERVQELIRDMRARLPAGHCAG